MYLRWNREKNKEVKELKDEKDDLIKAQEGQANILKQAQENFENKLKKLETAFQVQNNDLEKTKHANEKQTEEFQKQAKELESMKSDLKKANEEKKKLRKENNTLKQKNEQFIQESYNKTLDADYQKYLFEKKDVNNQEKIQELQKQKTELENEQNHLRKAKEDQENISKNAKDTLSVVQNESKKQELKIEKLNEQIKILQQNNDILMQGANETTDKMYKLTQDLAQGNKLDKIDHHTNSDSTDSIANDIANADDQMNKMTIKVFPPRPDDDSNKTSLPKSTQSYSITDYLRDRSGKKTDDIIKNDEPSDEITKMKLTEVENLINEIGNNSDHKEIDTGPTNIDDSKILNTITEIDKTSDQIKNISQTVPEELTRITDFDEQLGIVTENNINIRKEIDTFPDHGPPFSAPNTIQPKLWPVIDEIKKSVEKVSMV